MSRKKKGSDFTPGFAALRLAPLPPSVRLDMSIPLGEKGSLPASRFVWVEPPRGQDKKAVFEALILPN
jgi:hypothetical protein